MKKYYLFLLCFAADFNVMAIQTTTEELASLKEKINRAIIKVEQTQKKRWFYTVARYENEEGDITSSIEQHSPLLTEPWLLKKINGELPTSKQMNDFAEKKKEQSNKSKNEGSLKLSLRELINPQSLSLVSTDDKHIVMAFNVYLKKLGKDSQGKLQGKLTYQKDKQFIEKILIWNSEEFSPMFTATITDLAITFTFAHINGSVLAKKNEMKMKGSFAYFTEINETSTDNFSDYRYQGNKTP